MIRFILTCVLLLAMRPSMAAASACAYDAAETHSLAPAGAEYGYGAVRPASGAELLAGLTTRVSSWLSEGKARGPRKVREGDPVAADLRLAVRSPRPDPLRERKLPCGDSPFTIYLPYHANPPPVLP